MLVLADVVSSTGFDWTKLVGVPAAAVALLTLLGYALGLVRPLAITKAVYYHDGDKTYARVSVANRSLTFDRNVEEIMVVRLPGWWKRLRVRSWRSESQPTLFVPWGGDLVKTGSPVKLTKREERTFEFELRLPSGVSQALAAHPRDRVEVKAGHRRSRSRKLKYVARA